MTPWLSIIIPVRKEPPAHLWFTLQSLAFDDLDGVEILVVDNTEEMDDEVSRITSSFGAPVRYLHAPMTQSPYHPRNIGAAAAKGEWLLFLDAHVLLRPDAVSTLRQRVGYKWQDGVWVRCYDPIYHPMSMVHFPVGFRNQKTWYGHYRLTLEKNFWGEWGPTVAVGAQPIQPIGASGIWAFLTRKQDWEAVRGFNPNFSGYGGGEIYIQLKYWRMGGQVVLDPRLWGTHYSAPRGYAAHWKDRIRNVGIAGTVVVGPDFWKRFEDGLVAYYTSKGVSNFLVRSWLREGTNLGLEESEWLASVAPLTFDQVRAKWVDEGVKIS